MTRALSLSVFILVVLEIFSFLPPRRIQKPQSQRDYRRGAIHVHSSGATSGAQIADAARAAGLDFVVVADEGNTRLRKKKQEKRYKDVDLYVEIEAKTPAGHAVLFYSHTSARDLKDEAASTLAWRHFLGQESTPGVFLAVAHPSSPVDPWNRLDRFTEGIETINLRSMGERGLRYSPLRQLVTIGVSGFNPFLAAARSLEPYAKDFLAWDAMNAVSPGHFSYIAHDAQAELHLGEKRTLLWPPFESFFKLASNIIFLPKAGELSFEAAKRATYEALRGGRAAMAFEFLFPFEDNEWSIVCRSKRFRSGAEISSIPPGGCDSVVALPRSLPWEAKLLLYRDGEVFRDLEDPGALSRLPIDTPGVYRLEVWIKARSFAGLLLNDYVPYVLYNPIYVR